MTGNSVCFTDRLRKTLRERAAADLYRCRRVSQGPQDVEVLVDGRPMLAFCSNDYLGLAAHPEVTRAFVAGAERWGVGGGSAHLVNGHTTAHHALEEELADLTGRPRALLFSTGYMANMGVIAALVGSGDHVYLDRLNHASLLDGGLLSKARFQRYRHADPLDLSRRLEAKEGPALVVTDGVFSMDGDIAPLPALAELTQARGAWLMVDDAHGLGVLGATGAGSLEHFGLDSAQVPVLIGTLGKAFGTFGGFVAGSEELVETIIQSARPYIYTTASPPALAEATRASLRIARRETWRRERLRAVIRRFRRGCEELGVVLPESTTPIQPVLVGEAQRAIALARDLEGLGVLITPIRPPTVPRGTARLRITFSALHGKEHVDRLLDALETVGAASYIDGRAQH